MTLVVIVVLRLDRRASFVLHPKLVCVVDAPIKSEHDGNEGFVAPLFPRPKAVSASPVPYANSRA